MSSVTTLGTVNRAPLLASFLEATCSKLTCRGCDKELLNAVVCCEVDDDQGKKVEHTVHTICETCFDARVHMKGPGSVDKCRFCVEDKKANQRLIVGDPKKRRAKNQAYNDLAMEARKLVEGEEEIRRKELVIERAPIEAQRHAAAQAARERRQTQDAETVRLREALEKERKEFEETQRRVTEEARERAAALEEQRAAATARAEYEAQTAKETAERETRRVQVIETTKTRKRVLDPDVVQQRNAKAKETRELKKAKLAEYDAMAAKAERSDRVLEVAKYWIAKSGGDVDAFLAAIGVNVMDVD